MPVFMTTVEITVLCTKKYVRGSHEGWHRENTHLEAYTMMPARRFPTFPVSLTILTAGTVLNFAGHLSAKTRQVQSTMGRC